MPVIATHYGPLPVTGTVERHPDGTLRAACLDSPVFLATSLGLLRPQHTMDDTRHQSLVPVAFHQNGLIRSLPLEARTMVATPAGELPVELVTFHDTGAVARVFPLNGKLSGYWTEADEARLAETLTISTPLGPMTAKFVAVAFDAAGGLRSLTLWPDEVVTVATPAGEARARLGLSFHPNGALRSLEPAGPLEVPTPVGSVRAYDPDAVGVCGDDNSLVFSPEGVVTRVATIGTAVTARLADGSETALAPGLRESLCGEGESEPVPLGLEFFPDRITARGLADGRTVTLPTAGTTFTARPYVAAFAVPFAPRRCSM
jgi:hypothetical protein